MNVQWTGVPLIVSLAKPGGGTVDRQGNGSVRLQYNATADDVKKGMLWGVSIRPVQEAPKPAGSGNAVIEKPVRIDTRGLAKGNVAVQHPPGDMKLAQPELKARADKTQALKPQPATVAPKMDVLAQKQAALQKQKAVRQAALLEQVKPKLPIQAYQQMSRRIALGEQPGASKGIIIVDTGSINIPPGASSKTAASGNPLARKSAVAIGKKSAIGVSAVKATGTSAPAQVSSVGSNAQAMTVPDPVIASLSISSGQPGDPVLLSGSGFFNDGGEVHFIVANGKDVPAPVSAWSDTQIFAAVPDVSGIQGYNGMMYVRRGAQNSKLVPFHYIPATEFKTLVMTNDRALKDTPNWDAIMVGDEKYLDIYYSGGWLGARGDDQFFLQTRLKNGWTVDSAYLMLPPAWGVGYFNPGNGWNAYIADFRPGTDSPYLKVHWWKESFKSIAYSIRVVIKGPKGVPYE